MGTVVRRLDRTHTSLAVLSFYRSPRSGQSWVASGGRAVMDSAALAAPLHSVFPEIPQADLCIRAGF